MQNIGAVAADQRVLSLAADEQVVADAPGKGVIAAVAIQLGRKLWPGNDVVTVEQQANDFVAAALERVGEVVCIDGKIGKCHHRYVPDPDVDTGDGAVGHVTVGIDVAGQIPNRAERRIH